MFKIGIFSLSLVLVLGFGFGNSNIQNEETSIEILAKTPKIGELAPEINLPSINRSVTYKLSDLRGKLVLVNFWASMNAPCSHENKNQVRTYNKYKNKSFKNAQGFTIYSVSLDSNLESWKKAIKKDGLSWPYQVSDLKGYESEVAVTYGVTTIPSNYLIDGDGKVLAINLRSAQLVKTIEKYLK